jgi:trigger factor
LGDVASVEVEKLTADVTEEAIDKTVDILRKQRRTFAQRPAVEAAVDGDRATIDFLGTIDGVAFEGGKADAFQFLVGDGQMLKEFEDAVRGMKTGESKTFPLSFPEDYHGKDVAGKTADFMVTVNKLEAATMPAIDEEFVKSLGVSEHTVDALRADIRTNLQREVKARLQARNKQAAMDGLVAKAELDLPSAAVQAELDRMVVRARADLKQRGVKDADKAPIPDDVFRPQAERRVRLGLVVAELVRAENLQATPDQIKAHITEMAASYERPEDVVKWYTGDQSRMAEVEAVVIENNVTEFVLGKAKVSDKVVDFDELMAQQ